MTEASRGDLTGILAELREGEASAQARLIEAVYAELRALAGACLRKLPPGATLQPTALVHEAFVKLAGPGVEWRDRAHFFAAAAVVMRGILADHARRRRAAKRGGGWRRVTLANVATPSLGDALDMLAVDEALGRLEALHPRQALLIQYRFFAGMTETEAAHVLGVSRTTVAGEWKMARAWLSAELSGGSSS